MGTNTATRRRRPVDSHGAHKTTIAVSVEFDLVVNISDEPVDGLYPASVDPFGIATFGTSQADALEHVQDAIESYVCSLVEHNEVLSEFERLGVTYRVSGRVVTRDLSPRLEIDDTQARHRPARGHALMPAGT